MYTSNQSLKTGSTSIVKSFPASPVFQTWKYANYKGIPNYLTPTNLNANVYIPNNLVVGGTISNPSDICIKDNIIDIEQQYLDGFMQLSPKQYILIKETDGKPHFGFIAQDVEPLFPHLVNEIISLEVEGSLESTECPKEMKTINYLEMIPLLVLKIQDLQRQLDECKQYINER